MNALDKMKLMGSGFHAGKATVTNKKFKTLRDTQHTNRAGAVALATAYTRVTSTRKSYLKKYEGYKNFYLVDAILGSIYDDALTPDATTGEILTITCKDKGVKKELEKLQKSVDLDQLIGSFAEDLIGDGEYTLRVDVEPNVGVVDLKDDVNQANMVALYEKGLPAQYLQQTKDSIAVLEPYEYAHFCMGGKKLRIRIHEELTNDKKERVSDKIPSYARIGKPLFYGTLSKLAELQLLEALVPATKVSELTKGSLVGVGVPNSVSPDQAFQICREYEQVFNETTGLNRDIDELTTANILGVAGKTKAVPLFGDKGSIDSLTDTKKNSSVDDILNSVEDLRTVICSSIGFPPELLFGGEAKAETLKRYARYLRKLKSLQMAIAQGVKQIAMIHLKNCADKSKFKDIKIADIDVVFNNQLISIDELEKLEFSDALVSTVQDVFEFLTSIKETEGFEDVVNTENVAEWLRQKVSLIQTNLEIIDLKAAKKAAKAAEKDKAGVEKDDLDKDIDDSDDSDADDGKEGAEKAEESKSLVLGIES